MAYFPPANQLSTYYSGLDVLYDLHIIDGPAAPDGKPKKVVAYRYDGLCRVLTSSFLPMSPRANTPVPIYYPQAPNADRRPYFALAGQFVPAHLVIQTLKTGDPTLLELENWPGFASLTPRQKIIVRGLLAGGKGRDVAKAAGVSAPYASTAGVDAICPHFPFNLKSLKIFRKACTDAIRAGIKAADDYAHDRSFLRTPEAVPEPYVPKVGWLISDEDVRLMTALVETVRWHAEREGQPCHLNPMNFLPLRRLCPITHRQFHWLYNPPVLVRREYGPYTHDNVALVDKTAASKVGYGEHYIQLPASVQATAYPALSQL